MLIYITRNKESLVLTCKSCNILNLNWKTCDKVKVNLINSGLTGFICTPVSHPEKIMPSTSMNPCK